MEIKEDLSFAEHTEKIVANYNQNTLLISHLNEVAFST